MSYRVYLGNTLLPVTPGQIKMKINGNNKTANLMNDGEINILKNPGLTTVDFETLLPNQRYSFARYKGGFKKASYFLAKLEALKMGKQPFRFIVTRKLHRGRRAQNTNLSVSLEDYEITEDAGNGFDVKVKISLKQYKAYGTKIVTIQPKKEEAVTKEQRPAESSPAPKQGEQKSYTVKKGDTLWKIAKKFYGSGAQYPKIAEANPSIKNPNRIYAGQTFVIP